MKRISYVLATLLLLTGAQSVMAQLLVELKGETNQTLGLLDYHNYEFTVTNTGFGPALFYVERVMNGLPDPDWFSTICMEELCYAPEIDKPESVTVDPGQTYHVKFTVYTGEISNTQGKFILKFFTDGFGGVEFGSYEMDVLASDLSHIPEPPIAVSLPYPNPATTTITLPLSEVENVGSVEMYDIAGSIVRSLSGSEITGEMLRVSTEDLTPGIYYYKIIGTEESRVGTFHVVR
ncbi:MAG: T9SS type A sorting domain-containing protein [Candidatus Kapaibacterium sp.]